MSAVTTFSRVSSRAHCVNCYDSRSFNWRFAKAGGVASVTNVCSRCFAAESQKTFTSESERTVSLVHLYLRYVGWTLMPYLQHVHGCVLSYVMPTWTPLGSLLAVNCPVVSRLFDHLGGIDAAVIMHQSFDSMSGWYYSNRIRTLALMFEEAYVPGSAVEVAAVVAKLDQLRAAFACLA